MSVIYSLKNVVKSRVVDGAGFRLLVPSVEIKAQENVALVGHSGCGKSTLLDMMALALHPDAADDFTLSPDDDEPQDIACCGKRKSRTGWRRSASSASVTCCSKAACCLT
jgi:putative ABC transport system ATP-binding protein